MYPWLVFLHILGVLGFLMAHGVTIFAFFALRRERNLERICMLLEMSRSTLVLVDISILVLLISGITAGFLGHFWSRAWIWVSIVLLIAIFVSMEMLGTKTLNKIRLALGLPSTRGEKPSLQPATLAEVEPLLPRSQPVQLASIGLGGLAVIAWLMVFKPF
jgi:hypothetical protein